MKTKALHNHGFTNDALSVALVGFLRRGIDRLVTRRRIRRGIEEFMAFDDRTLADIGLTRLDIEYVIRQWRPLDG